MNIYIPDFAIIVATIAAVIFVTLAIRVWRRRQVNLGLLRIERDEEKAQRLKDREWETGGGPRSLSFLDSRLYKISERQAQRRNEILDAERRARRLNLITSLIALVPIVIAIVNLILNRPQNALAFDIVGFAVLILSKIGVFLLAVLQKVPVMLGAKFISDKSYERIKEIYEKLRRTKKPVPTE
jgi:hypothetical protein